MATLVPTVTPVAGANYFIAVGGTPVVAAFANPNGGYITNPLTSADQGIGSVEVLIVDPTGASPGPNANGTAIALQPGQTWDIIPGQTTITMVYAATTGHKYTVIVY